MGRALHAEWTKLRTVAGTSWLLLAVVALTAALGAAAAAAVACPSAGCGQDPVKVSLTGIEHGYPPARSPGGSGDQRDLACQRRLHATDLLV